MNKRNILLALLISVLFVFTGCKGKNIPTDYSEYAFTDVSWTRKAEHDTETIRFGSDGSFSYFCGCGNPVNDSDLNEGYTYDDKTKTITIKYIETTDETVSTIKIETCNDESIKLNFNGETREFVKENK